ncbi:hypothetical protein F5Y15DRAFT_134940 [Xylariaceae sp. FL0016]|nr:hypothetical protein F5Y15DRAFT_134940 [Xylariaceae sp. FL0016]
MAADDLESEVGQSFHHFPDLPTEIRLKIWEEHFCLPRIHILMSGPPRGSYPNHIALDALTNCPAANLKLTIQARLANREAYGSFKKYCRPQRLKLKRCAPSQAEDTAAHVRYFLMGKPDLANHSLRELLARKMRRDVTRPLFNLNQDLLYVVDYENGAMFAKLCSSSWMPEVQRIALAIIDFSSGPWCTWSGQMKNDILDCSHKAKKFLSAKAGRFHEFYLVIIPPPGQRSSA